MCGVEPDVSPGVRTINKERAAAQMSFCLKFFVAVIRSVFRSGFARNFTSLPQTRFPPSVCACRILRRALKMPMRNTPRSFSDSTAVFSRQSNTR